MPRRLSQIQSFKLVVLFFLCSCWQAPDLVNSQENEIITIVCVAQREIKQGRELFSRDGKFKGSKIESYLVLKKGDDEIRVRDVLSSFVWEKKLRYVLTKKNDQSNYVLLEIWDSNLQLFPTKTREQIRANSRKRLENELSTPDEGLWVNRNGLQFQLTAAKPFAFTNATTFEYYIWIRNTGKKDRKWRVIAGPQLVPHFQLQVETELGKSMMLGECRKKHAYQDIVIPAGKTKSFRCDLFTSSCDRVKPFHEIPMTYVLDYQGAKLRFFTEDPKQEDSKEGR